MRKFLLTFLFAAPVFAGDLKVITTPSPKYTGYVSTSVIKDGNKVVATGVTITRPSYAGGGTVTTIKEVKGKTFTITSVLNKVPGGEKISTIKK